MNAFIKNLLNPFKKIAGLPALLIGFAGLVLAACLGYWNNWHYHGLLHFGPAPNPQFWCYAAEQLTVWLVPALLFYIGGVFLSNSRIRIIDVLGTTAFALLPLIGNGLLFMLPPMKVLTELDPSQSLEEVTNIMRQPEVLLAIWISLVGMIFLIWSLVWLWQALKVSCNLKGYRLGIIYVIAVFGGDMICRIIIRQFYTCL